jgi:putative ABC transport system ATP-binding protein
MRRTVADRLGEVSDDPSTGTHRPLFRFEGVDVAGGEGQRVLTGIALDIARDGVTVIVGPSGAGKTTLLRLCNRLDVPSSGRVLFEGHDVVELDPRALRRRVGMVFQQPVLFGGSVRDNLRVASPDADDQRLAAALDSVALSERFLDRRAGELSGGEAQRVCLARTLLTEPDALLMDEPTSALDPENRSTIEQLTLDLVARGVTVVWVTHDLAQARRLGGRLVVIADGRLATGEEAQRFVRGGAAPASEPGLLQADLRGADLLDEGGHDGDN